jgi:hypothetical protein
MSEGESKKPDPFQAVLHVVLDTLSQSFRVGSSRVVTGCFEIFFWGQVG